MGVASTVIYDEAKVMERYGLRPDQMLDYKALKGDTSDNIPGVPGVGEKTAIQLLQQFGTLDGIYERLDEVKGKLRDRLAEHRESAFLSREVGRIVTDLPVELDLDEARTGRYDRRAVAQRFRELEFRSLIDRLPPSSIAPTGYGPAERDTGRTAAVARPAGWRATRGTPLPTANGAAPADAGGTRPDAVSDPGGAIEHVDPRIVRSDADLAELEAWLAAHGEEVGLGWAAGAGRPLERPLLGIAMAGADGSTWYLPWSDDRPLPAWFGRADRPLIGHDLKQLVALLARRGVVMEGPAFDTLVASYMVNPALRAQTLDDLAANRYGTELPARPVSGEAGAEETVVARRAAAEALTSLLVRPALEAELAEGGLGDLFNEVEMPLLPVLARDGAGGRDDRPRRAGGDGRRVRRQLAALEARIYELVGHPFNIGSPKQLEQILFHELELPATKRTRTGYSTDASVLEELRDKHEVVGLILEHRQVAKLKSTYVDALPILVGSDGRVHTTYSQAVAATGRLSSTDPEPPEHPDPHRAGPAHPARLRGAAGQAAARRRLLAAGAAHPGPRLRRRGAEGGLRRALRHPPGRRRARAGGAGGGGRRRSSAAWPR